MKRSKLYQKRTKLESSAKKNPKLEMLKRISPKAIARAIEAKMRENDKKTKDYE